ncbi:hypothetical protein Ddc_13800 [Ditylenchus destructor]|nr:hypothetical protein Ddc_13800 [Ditylenchus destructor]
MGYEKALVRGLFRLFKTLAVCSRVITLPGLRRAKTAAPRESFQSSQTHLCSTATGASGHYYSANACTIPDEPSGYSG